MGNEAWGLDDGGARGLRRRRARAHPRSGRVAQPRDGRDGVPLCVGRSAPRRAARPGSVRAMPQPFRVPDDLATHGLEFLPDGLVAAIGDDATVRFMNSHAERITGLCRRRGRRAATSGRRCRCRTPRASRGGSSPTPGTGWPPAPGTASGCSCCRPAVSCSSRRSTSAAGSGSRCGPSSWGCATPRGGAAPRTRTPRCSRPSPTSCAPRSPASRASPRPCCATGTGSPTTRSGSCSRRSRRMPTGSPASSPSCSTPRASTSAGSRCTPSPSTCGPGSRRRSSAGSPPAPTASTFVVDVPEDLAAAVGRPRPPRAGARQPRRERRAPRRRAPCASPPRAPAHDGRPAVDLLVSDDGDGIADAAPRARVLPLLAGRRQARHRPGPLPRPRPRRGPRWSGPGRGRPRWRGPDAGDLPRRRLTRPTPARAARGGRGTAGVEACSARMAGGTPL